MSDRPAPEVAALELNDAGLELAGPPGWSDLPPDPGIALVEEGGIVTGRLAQERARLAPRLARQDYWAQLGLEPLGQPFATGLRAADLAFYQLERLWSGAVAGLSGAAPTALVLAAPGSFTPAQLGLALAVGRRAGLPVTGCVDAAVAAAAAPGAAEAIPGAQRLVVLDLERTRAVATEIELAASGEVVRGRVVREDRVGLAGLHDAWARAVGREFVRVTRFDPLHLASTEQELYLRLPGWLARLADEKSIVVTIEAGGRVHQIELTREWMAAAAALAYERLGELARSTAGTASRPTGLLLTHRLRALPPLETPGGLTGHAFLPPGAALAGALAHAPSIHTPNAEELPLVVRLPRGG